MECISEMKDSLNVCFGWNKARLVCFVKRIILWKNNSDPEGGEFLATNLDEKWKKSNIMFTY
jgi:hypothetical protein